MLSLYLLLGSNIWMATLNDTSDIGSLRNLTVDLESNFADTIIRNNSITNVRPREGLDKEELATEARANIEALEPNDNLQILLLAQMMSVHNLQQRMMMYATNCDYPDSALKYVNIVTKLSNVFIQQTNLINKMKNGNQQKVVFEHVHVHSGAQAVVGALNTYPVQEPIK